MTAKIKTEMTNRVAALRMQRGLSAAALAQAVGVSRQTVYAIEAGTYLPNTATSLRMARALGASVDELFRLPDEPDEAKFPSVKAAPVPLEREIQLGQRVQLCRVNGKLVAAPAEPAGWCLPTSDGWLESTGRVRRHHPEESLGKRILLSGCDPAMGMVAGHLEKAGVQLLLLHQNSSRSLRLLKDGYAHVAGCHLANSNAEAVRELFPAKSAVLFSFATWQEGLALASGNPKGVRGLEDLARRDLRFVNRELGAGSRALLDRHLQRLGMDARTVQGYDTTATGHLAVAAEVRQGQADCCVTTEAAARLFGLHFIAMESVRYDLIVRKLTLRTPEMQVFLDSLNRIDFRRMLSGVAGYDTSATGSRCS